ncbi:MULTISPECIES: STAS domain-containing protein [Mycolicibacter]|uniref:Anti-sigma factor antagonist n=1 Tax=Mycolicibacter virginiensis TaxID=1795032 RepID=A0A9X7INI4_9MYCO|nr:MULTISPECIES: STAS domain-containing protein [Mycolicibacter]OBG31585.1 sulfate transporter [Mycolicibacter heraklionensis]PQM52199.1 anti-sigma factor antagonist [Mycolicibacter virginiensis]ULP46586.1 anti-sigma factor antagonist [Mycolicibacter virginiensis]
MTTVADICLLTATGTLDSSTYLELRDSVIKAALDEPPAVLVDVSRLDVPAPSAWSVFTSARWHVSTWPDIPILLICPQPNVAARISSTGVTRYVAVHADVESAVASLAHGPHPRRRARIALSHSLSSLRGSRDFVAEWLTNWSQDPLIPTAKVVVDVLVENVLCHTDSPLVLLLECADSTITIAVRDTNASPAMLREGVGGGPEWSSGLAVLGALCRAWGSSPTPSGKTVWAVLGQEDRL